MLYGVIQPENMQTKTQTCSSPVLLSAMASETICTANAKHADALDLAEHETRARDEDWGSVLRKRQMKAEKLRKMS